MKKKPLPAIVTIREIKKRNSPFLVCVCVWGGEHLDRNVGRFFFPCVLLEEGVFLIGEELARVTRETLGGQSGKSEPPRYFLGLDG